MNEVAKALHDGLDRLRERGLTKWELCNPRTGRVCARGAVLVAAEAPLTFESIRADVVLSAADRLLCAVALEQYPERVGYSSLDAIAWMNNDDDTTQEDVERVFEKAIVRAYELDASS